MNDRLQSFNERKVRSMSENWRKFRRHLRWHASTLGMEVLAVYQAKRPGVMKGPKENLSDCHPPCKAPLQTQTPSTTSRKTSHAWASSRNVTAAASIWEPWKRLTCAEKAGAWFLPAKVRNGGPARGLEGVREETFLPGSEERQVLLPRLLQALQADMSHPPVSRFLK